MAYNRDMAMTSDKEQALFEFVGETRATLAHIRKRVDAIDGRERERDDRVSSLSVRVYWLMGAGAAVTWGIALLI